MPNTVDGVMVEEFDLDPTKPKQKGNWVDDIIESAKMWNVPSDKLVLIYAEYATVLQTDRENFGEWWRENKEPLLDGVQIELLGPHEFLPLLEGKPLDDLDEYQDWDWLNTPADLSRWIDHSRDFNFNQLWDAGEEKTFVLIDRPFKIS